ncbi:uncharacterized protein CLUP02_17599 [Colletotrichum lupini]|uniref:Uncharacterized protein n=1 Tax=Colletotrichum lupini TaxID=145971 RepID=A0A9Q8W9Y4_9PEZI|nr:uncharacterized protein CLUP02_17599 [Colletotrichum lupini]UQC76088.1 hypothetical protein CLUP02_17599 [Colletotrichum lupini]
MMCNAVSVLFVCAIVSGVSLTRLLFARDNIRWGWHMAMTYRTQRHDEILNGRLGVRVPVAAEESVLIVTQEQSKSNM